MVTIKDIAKIAGVGVSTVSRALNGGAKVDKATFQKIIEAAKKLKYKPNYAARDLVRGNFSKKAVGVVLPVIAHPFFFEVVRGIYDALLEGDYNIMLFNTSRDREEVFSFIIREGLAGIIFVSEGLSEVEKNTLEINQYHYILIDHHQKNTMSFYIDNEFGGMTAARYLISQNCESIGYIGESIDTQQQNDRFGGFKDELKRNNREILIDERIPMDEKFSYQSTQFLVEKYPDLDGLFYFCDKLAYGGQKAVREKGKEIKIIGYDDMPSSVYLDLTTIRQPAYEIGYEGSKVLLNMFKAGYSEGQEKQYRLLPELQVRKS